MNQLAIKTPAKRWPNTRVKTLCFGSIETLVDTSEIQRQAFNRAFNCVGLDWYWSVCVYDNLAGCRDDHERIQTYALSPLSDQKLKEVVRIKSECFTEMLLGGEIARPGVVELIQAAKSDNIPIYWVTTSPELEVTAVLKALQGQISRDDFDRIYVESDIYTPKPDPAIYQLALQHAKKPAHEVLAVEDTFDNLQAAQAAGLNTVLFPAKCRQSIAGLSAYSLTPTYLNT